MDEFSVECFQNQYLSRGGSVMHAVVHVQATGSGPGTSASSADAEAAPN